MEPTEFQIDEEIISEGAPIEPSEHVVPGKFTIMKYHATWCPSCRSLAKGLGHELEDRDDVAVRTIDIINWESQVAVQAAKEFDLDVIPYTRIYSAGGAFLGHVKGGDVQGVMGFLR